MDVNVLIGLVNPKHVHHQIVKKWFSNIGADTWVTCPITELGFVRIVSNPSFESEYDRPIQASNYLDLLKKRFDNHEFWADTISLTEENIIDVPCIISWKHLTDAYLLGIAYKNNGKLVTLDRGISTNWLKDKKANIIEHL